MRYLLLLLLTVIVGCSSERIAEPGEGVSLLVIGDSLTAGHGIADPDKNAWPALLEYQWQQEGFLGSGQRVINAGISGDTTEGGARRISDLLDQHQPKAVAIALGANDVRRRARNSHMRANLDYMVRVSKKHGARVILIGVDLPGALSLAASGEPNKTIEKVARDHDLEVAYIPLNLAYRQKMMLDDQIHPNAEAQALIAQALRDKLEDIMAQ